LRFFTASPSPTLGTEAVAIFDDERNEEGSSAGVVMGFFRLTEGFKEEWAEEEGSGRSWMRAEESFGLGRESESEIGGVGFCVRGMVETLEGCRWRDSAEMEGLLLLSAG
jgi:hypothetical protein